MSEKAQTLASDRWHSTWERLCILHALVQHGLTTQRLTPPEEVLLLDAVYDYEQAFKALVGWEE